MEDKLEDLKIIRDFEHFALNEVFNDTARLLFSAGAGNRSTPTDNEDAFHRYRIRPRMLRNVLDAQTSCEILGQHVSSPIGVSPTFLHVLAHNDRELASSAGACREGCIFVLSSYSSSSMDEVARAVKSLDSPNIPWMQIYLYKDRGKMTGLIRKAEELNFGALVVTVDSSVPGQMKNLFNRDIVKDVFRRSSIINIPRSEEDASLTYEDLKWVKENTNLPIVVKGILSGEDAVAAAKCGAKGIWVSNHGSRLIQRCIAPIDVLEEVCAAVRETGVEVYVDGGVRSGTDVFVALALGAKAVFVGRPALWGLAADGENGVRKVLQILKTELLQTMMLSGVSRLEDIDKLYVRRNS